MIYNTKSKTFNLIIEHICSPINFNAYINSPVRGIIYDSNDSIIYKTNIIPVTGLTKKDTENIEMLYNNMKKYINENFA